MSEKGASIVRLGHEINKDMSESGLRVDSAGEYLGSPMWNSNVHWQVQDPWLGTGLVRGCACWVRIPTGKCKSQNWSIVLG